MAKIRVLVAEDSLTVRKRLCAALTEDPDLQVVGEAADGKAAIELCQALHPDVMTMDMMMPVMTGLGATEYIMAHVPTPILIVSSSINRGELFRTYDALAAGAVDVLEKPRGDEPDGHWERALLATVKLVSRIRVITHPRGRLGSLGRAWPGPPTPDLPARAGGAFSLVALGASTGGPGALVEILRSLPAPFPLPVFIVLHINEPFGQAFADWLDAQTPHRVVYARHGEPLEETAGKVILAPPNQHLELREGRLALNREPERHSCRPSVDILFESVARQVGHTAIACLLTGMGRDGAQGLLEIRRAGGFTIAQDEASAVVYGMPREAALLDAADRILPLGQIGPALVSLVGRQTEATG